MDSWVAGRCLALNAGGVAVFQLASLLAKQQPAHQGSQVSMRVARESWGWRSSHCRAEETSPGHLFEGHPVSEGTT